MAADPGEGAAVTIKGHGARVPSGPAVAAAAMAMAGRPISKISSAKVRDQFKGMFPGGFGFGLIAIIVLIVAAFWVMQSVYTIQPDQRGVELRLR